MNLAWMGLPNIGATPLPMPPAPPDPHTPLHGGTIENVRMNPTLEDLLVGDVMRTPFDDLLIREISDDGWMLVERINRIAS